MYSFYLSLLILLLLPVKAWSVAVDESQMQVWESEAILEINKHKAKNPEKEFLLYMIAGRELASHGLDEKARQYYLKAYEHPSKSDKSEAVIQLVALQRENKKELPAALKRARDWFKKSPQKASPEIKRWLNMMEGYAAGKTPYLEQGFHSVWAVDERVTELMKEGNAAKAFQILGPLKLESADINQRLRQDLLSALNLGKEATPPLWCLPTLQKYPTSITWSMRICRYLDDWKNGRKSRESIQSISKQIKAETPERLYWVHLLERL